MKNLPHWLKGGIIFGIVIISLSFIIPLLFNYDIGQLLIKIIYVPLIIFPAKILGELLGGLFFHGDVYALISSGSSGFHFIRLSVLGYIIIFIVYFILGVIISGIYGKIKK